MVILRRAREQAEFPSCPASFILQETAALAHLQPRPDDAVLDLFCGLGNFTLPLARRVRRVLGVEGDASLLSGYYVLVPPL